MATIYSIHPAIGIARVGDSELYEDDGRTPKQESYFLGPEDPATTFEPGPYNASDEGRGNYRDSRGAVRRQAARFRVYEKEVDDFGRVVRVKELTSADAQITWTVSVANKKGSGKRFPPYYLDELPAGFRLRNPSVADRSDLEIEARSSVSPKNKARKLQGRFMGETVKLGDIFTDENGRLIFLGGHGKAGSPTNKPLGTPSHLPRHGVYNNDGWFDDTSDGWISARVRIGNKPGFDVHEKAWIIVAPPDHAPAVQNPVTLYDVVFQACLPHRPELASPQRPSFKRDVYPILRRTVDLQWTSEDARFGHSGNGPGNFMKDDVFRALSSNTAPNKFARQNVVAQLTPFGSPGPGRNMPRIFGGVDPNDPSKKPPASGTYGIPLTMTLHQFRVLDLWVQGSFNADFEEQLPDLVETDALDQAAIDACCGGSFHPGIEAPYIMALEGTYSGWFRINYSMEPGDLTQGLAVPWQTDFAACSVLWWPAQRPNSVLVREGEETKAVSWIRGARQLEDLLQLGFVKPDEATEKFLEFERVLPEPPSDAIV